MLTSTLPRFAGDMQADFVGEQARAWKSARPGDELAILAPHHALALQDEQIGGVKIRRFRYFRPEGAQRLAYPAILPNIRRNPLLALQLPFFLAAEFRAARRLAREMRADCIYAHWVMPQGLVAWLLHRVAGIPYVLQNHSSDLTVFSRFGGVGRALARAILRDAAHFFCVNSSQRDFALALFDGAERDAFAARCTVLPMGIAGLPDTAEIGGEWDIVTIGRLSRKKGLDLLIRAAERLAVRGIRPRIAIAGDGEERAALQSLVRQADVHFPGFLTGAEKARFLATARSFAFPALAADGDVEGLPVALLEGLARGRPVLASRDTNIAMLPEWPKIRGGTVYLENPADLAALESGLEQLLQMQPDPLAAQAVGRYRWERLIGEYLAALDRAVPVQATAR
ncbi:MAG: glycosyltransferase [Croceibacterium sp.]